MRSLMKAIRSFLVVVCVLALTPIARSQSLSPEAAAANASFQAQKWAESAKGYEAITKAQPKNPNAYYRLGVSLHAMGKYQEAIPTLQKAVEIGESPLAMYGLARAHAKLNDKAFEWLNNALNAGFYRVSQFNDDADLTNLRDDPRFERGRRARRKTYQAVRCATGVQAVRLLDWRMGRLQRPAALRDE